MTKRLSALYKADRKGASATTKVVAHKLPGVAFKVNLNSPRDAGETFKIALQSVVTMGVRDLADSPVRKHRVLKPALTSKRIASEDLDAAVRSVAG